MQVEVADTTPPGFVLLEAVPATLWPPNHKLRDVQIRFAATDVCDAGPSVALVEARSSEPDDAIGMGDGNTRGDIRGAQVGVPDEHVLLRAERAGTGQGRTYVLTYEARDASGNTVLEELEVLVPHDQREPD